MRGVSLARNSGPKSREQRQKEGAVAFKSQVRSPMRRQNHQPGGDPEMAAKKKGGKKKAAKKGKRARKK